MTKMSYCIIAITSLTVAGLYHFTEVQDAAAQSGSRYGSGRRGEVQRDAPFEARFWHWLDNVHYTNWAPAAGQDGGFYPGQSPHGAQLKMYLNRTAAANPKQLPHGSVVIKENYSPEQQLMTITVMYRAKGYDPDHNDWYWVKYNADGSVSRTLAEKGNKKIAGRFQSCIDCHSGADGNDFAFFND